MPAFEKQDRAARLFKVAQIIAGGGGIKTADLAARIGRHQRTALRDILALGDIGVPVYLDDDGRWKISEGYLIPAIAFTQPEAVALLMAGRLAARHADRNDRVLGMALTKIARAMPEEARLVAEFFDATASELAAKPDDARRSAIVDTLVRGWLGRRKVRIVYRDAKGKRTVRVVRPYYIEPSEAMAHGTYVIGFDEQSSEVRSFKVERIVSATLEKTQYYLPRDFSLSRYLRHSWGIWSNAPVERVVIRFSSTAAPRIKEALWHASQKLTGDKGGGLRMEVRVRGWTEILPWILSWGADAEVIAPAGLRDAAAGVAARLAATYRI